MTPTVNSFQTHFWQLERRKLKGDPLKAIVNSLYEVYKETGMHWAQKQAGVVGMWVYQESG